MGRAFKRWGLALAGLAAVMMTAAGAARASGPVAIVEDIDAAQAKVGLMDYLETGRVIELGARGTAVLGYLQSCLRESITGGTVTVGAGQSAIKGGNVRRERVDCDGGQLQLSAAEAGKSAVLVLRKPPSASKAGWEKPSLTLYGRSPVLRLSHGGTVRIERLDRGEREVTVDVEGKYLDLAKAGVSLAPGGIYRVKVGERSIVFRIDAYARSGPGPIIGRLISF